MSHRSVVLSLSFTFLASLVAACSTEMQEDPAVTEDAVSVAAAKATEIKKWKITATRASVTATAIDKNKKVVITFTSTAGIDPASRQPAVITSSSRGGLRVVTESGVRTDTFSKKERELLAALRGYVNGQGDESASLTSEPVGKLGGDDGKCQNEERAYYVALIAVAATCPFVETGAAIPACIAAGIAFGEASRVYGNCCTTNHLDCGWLGGGGGGGGGGSSSGGGAGGGGGLSCHADNSCALCDMNGEYCLISYNQT